MGLEVHYTHISVVDLGDGRFGGSLDSHKPGLSAWLSSEMVALTVHQTHTSLGSALG